MISMTNPSAQTSSKSPAPSQFAVSRKDLPLYCPGKQAELWSMHPRVYLAIEKTGHATCPYCGAEYHLQD